MPIITAKYALPSIMACANVSRTVESQHVSVGSNSFAALSHSEINLLPSRYLCTSPTQKEMHMPVLIGLCKPKTKFLYLRSGIIFAPRIHRIVNILFSPSKTGSFNLELG